MLINCTTIYSVNSNKEIDGGLISYNVTVYTIYPPGLFASPSYRSNQHSHDRKLIVTNQLTIMNNNSSTIIY